MQGITVAIFPEGIIFFVESLFAPNGDISKTINGATLANFQVTVPQDIFFMTGQNEAADCSNINIQFSNGSISNFTPIFQSLQQEKEGVFQLKFSSDPFNANYSWLESYTRQNQTYEQSDNPDDPGEWVNDGNSYLVSTPFPYSAGIGSLTTNSNLTFTFDSSKNLWELPVTSITAVASNPSANIPGNSILQDQDQPGCVQSHVDSATEASIDSGTDFSKSITTAFGGYLDSIPASGQLYQGSNGTITFAFGLGDSPLTFPNDIGLSVGVTGISTYTAPGQSSPQQFPGTPPANLPVPSTAPIFLFGGIPASEAANFDAQNIDAIKADFATYSTPPQQPNQPPPSPQYPLINPIMTVITAGSEWLVVDSNSRYRVQLIDNQLQVFYTYHLQIYVSDYVINGLYWAFANAGQLTETVTPEVLSSLHLDTSVLDVQTYINGIPNIPIYQNLLNDLSPYSQDAMYAHISPQIDSNNQPIPPTVEFGTAYVFNSTNMSTLQSQMPDVYKVIQPTAISGHAYATKDALVDALSDLNKKKIQIDPSLFPQIEQYVQEYALVVTHNVKITCTIQDSSTPPAQLPYFICTMQRYDILTDLKLGISASGNAQTLQFTHTDCKPDPVFTMVESNFITDSNDLQFFIVALTQGGEPVYNNLLNTLGSNGTPIPIMQGFQFVFEEALVNLEQGYIGILANVEFTS